MTPEDSLREKLRKIEALYAGAATPGEKAAAGAAAERIRRQFETASKSEPPQELKFSIPIRGRGNSSSRCAADMVSGHSAIAGCTAKAL